MQTSTLTPAKRFTKKLEPRAKTARRLIKLADLLDAVPPENFDMDRWIGMYEEDEYGDRICQRTADSTEDLIEITQQGFNCGTTACVAGWAAWMFRDELPKMPTTGYQASAERTDTISGMALKVLGLEWSSSYGDTDLFSSSAPWQTPKAAAIECRRRAVNIMYELNAEASRGEL